MKTAPCKNKAVHLSLSTAPSPCGVCVGTALPALLIPAWDFLGQWDGPAEQGQLTARAWAVTPTVPLHMRLPGSAQQRAAGHPQQAPAAFWGIQHLQSGSLHSSSRHLQNPEARKAEKELLSKVVIYFFPLSKIKLFYSLPSPSIPQALPGLSLQPQAHLENVEMSEPGWGYQSIVPGKKQLSGSTGHLCPQPGRVAAQLPGISLGNAQQSWHHITGSS